MKKFKVKLNKNSVGVSAISLVDTPAIDSNFIKLSNDNEIKEVLKLESDDKMIVTGAVLIPDKEIYRNSNFCKGECTISFEADTILEMSKLFLRGDVDNKQTIQHMFPTDQAQLIESWIISDASNDKAIALGMDLPVGTWMASYQITDDNLWKSIKDGNINGFSIEASAVDMVEITCNKQTNPCTDASDEEIMELVQYINTLSVK